MAYAKVKTNGMGKGKRRWITRFEAKQSAKRRRRREDKNDTQTTR